MTTTRTPAHPVLLTGGTGTTGRRVAALLGTRGVPVRIASRTGTPSFSWQDRATWPAQVRDTRAVYLCCSPDLAVPGAAELVADLARCAVEHDVARLVLLSGRGEPGAQQGERLVREVAESAGAAWTVVRSAWFAQNFAESILLDEVRSGVVRLPVGGVREPFVDVDDVAEVVVTALVDDVAADGHAHDGRVHEVTGPESLTFAEALARVSAAAGRPVRLETTTREEHVGGLRAAGVDEDVVRLMDHLFTEVLDGRNAAPTDGVQQALGRPPRAFTEHLPAAAASWAHAS